jgi:hypothetical protein
VESGPNFEYERGPDGKRYAVSGSVSIDSSPVQGKPQATIDKMRQVRQAALAPAQPSAQDRQVAAKAQRAIQQARSKLEAGDGQSPANTADKTTSPATENTDRESSSTDGSSSANGDAPAAQGPSQPDGPRGADQARAIKAYQSKPERERGALDRVA